MLSLDPSKCQSTAGHQGVVFVQEYRLARDVIAQLQTLGGLEHWEIFVAMHLPQEADEQDPTVVVKELLTRHAPAFLEDSQKLEFLKDMNLPQPWVSEAFAIWTKYTGDAVGKFLPTFTLTAPIPCHKARDSSVFEPIEGYQNGD